MTGTARKQEPQASCDLLDGIREAFAQPGVRRRFLLAWIDEQGWAGGYRRADARLSQWLSGDSLYRFPAQALLTLTRACGHARFVDVVLAEESRTQRALRADERIGPMRSVRPEQRRGRDVA